jgi:hypothetical protein
MQLFVHASIDFLIQQSSISESDQVIKFTPLFFMFHTIYFYLSFKVFIFNIHHFSHDYVRVN